MQPIPEEHHASNRAFYDRISQAYDFIADANEHRARETGEAALQLQPGETVLEIGFGTGNSLINLARLVGPTGKVHGIDISSGMQAVAQEKLREAGLSDQVELTLGDARELPYPAESMDAVFTSFTLELFPEDDIPTVLAECQRVLHPGARLGVVSMATVPEGESASTLEKVYVWMHRHFPHIVDCRPIDVTALLQKAGFTVISQSSLSIWSLPVAAVVAKKA